MQNNIFRFTRAGIFSAHIINPAWQGEFPFDWPKEKWPLAKIAFSKKNQITEVGQLRSYTHGLNFKYIAGGDGTAAPSPSDTSLNNELQRFLVENIIRIPGQVEAYAFIPSGTGNVTWREWGVFLDDASSGNGSGTIYGHVLQAFTKNLGDNVLLTYTVQETVE
jgi:hypothetical protein